jgi:hypothetical protein
VANATGFQTFLNSLIGPTDASPERIMVGGEPFATHNDNLNTGSGYPVGCTDPGDDIMDVRNPKHRTHPLACRLVDHYHPRQVHFMAWSIISGFSWSDLSPFRLVSQNPK